MSITLEYPFKRVAQNMLKKSQFRLFPTIPAWSSFQNFQNTTSVYEYSSVLDAMVITTNTVNKNIITLLEKTEQVYII